MEFWPRSTWWSFHWVHEPTHWSFFFFLVNECLLGIDILSGYQGPIHIGSLANGVRATTVRQDGSLWNAPPAHQAKIVNHKQQYILRGWQRLGHPRWFKECRVGGPQTSPFNPPAWSLKSSMVAQMIKSLPAMQEMWVWSLGWEDPLQKGIATHSSILAWRIPWTEEPGRL